MRIEPEDFAKTLKELREKEDISQQKATERMGATNHRTWGFYEKVPKSKKAEELKRTREPTLSMAQKLLKALGYTMTITITKDSN